jgi:hypothetical protein
VFEGERIFRGGALEGDGRYVGECLVAHGRQTIA